MLLRPLLLLALLAPGWAVADEAGLLIGNQRYAEAKDLPGGDAVLGAEDALRAGGIDVHVLRDADRNGISSGLRQLEQQSRRADSLLVALSGRFVSSDAETWFLPVDAEGASLIDTALRAIPLSAVMSLLGQVPGRAVLLLGTDLQDRSNTGSGLRHGVGALDIPQGVTVIRAEPDEAAAILSDTIARPGAAIVSRVRDSKKARIDGFAPSDLAFLPDGRAPTPVVKEDADRTALWDRARRTDTEAAYLEFLLAYPEGALADDAERRLTAIRNDPAFRARKAEDALSLSRAARQDIQRDLVMLGHDTRGIDGLFGPGTRGAIAAWQGGNDRARTGYLDRAAIDAIDAQARRRAAALQDESRDRAARVAAEEEQYWRQTGSGRTENGLIAFLTRYPDGNLADRAGRRLSEIRGAPGATDLSAREQLLWDRARDRNDVEGYTDYARAFPRGRHADQARRRIERLGNGQGNENAQAAGVENALGLNALTRRAVEQRLSVEGLRPGPVDGTFDGQTRQAIRRYQQQSQLPTTGYLDQVTVVRLLADTVRRVLQ